ncbi:MAG: hypothetical protein ACI9M9_000097 [Flavobacteriaceae bacterium]|jgi:hypothetical protein
MKTSRNLLLIAALILIFNCRADVSKELAPNITFNTETTSKHFIKVALLLDTSDSMDGLIDQAKAQLWKIVKELSYAKCKNESPNLQITLYEYGNDGLKATEGYVRKVLAFTDDLDDISKELFSLTTNGGSEYCGTVVQASLNKLDWGNDGDDLKMVFIAGNEPFTQGKIHCKDAASNTKEKGVIVNTIFSGNHQQGVATKRQDTALLTYGDYIIIDHNKKTVHINSPYDDIIIQLN